MDHLILFSVPFSNYDVRDEPVERKNITSLTAIKNDLILSSTGLKYYKFKHIRLEECLLKLENQASLDELLFSDNLRTLALMSGRDADPWFDFNYNLAPNLEELVINGFTFHSLEKNSNNKFPSLERLDLSDNRIGYINSHCFDDMSKLEEINLENNNLYSFHLSSVAHFKRILLDGNPLTADVRTCMLLRAPQVFLRNVNLICDEFENLMSPGTSTTTTAPVYQTKTEL